MNPLAVLFRGRKPPTCPYYRRNLATLSQPVCCATCKRHNGIICTERKRGRAVRPDNSVKPHDKH